MPLRVGISSGWESGRIVEGWPLVYTVKSAVEKVERAGAVPFVLPIVEDFSLIDRQVEVLDFLILSGEVLSIKRNVFDEHETNVLRASNPLRYDNEAALVRAATARGLPLIGICRGLQVLAAETGGSVADEDVDAGNFIIHQQGQIAPPSRAVHSVRILPGTTLLELVGSELVMVNSFHRQAVKKIPPGFRVAAVSEDGAVEAIEKDGGGPTLGVQFHPEIIGSPAWDGFFKRLLGKVEEVRERI